MFSERPSRQKVVGVSYRYLLHLEMWHAAEADKSRFNNEELDIESSLQIAYSLARAATRGIVERPLQKMRYQFLRHAQEVEGRMPGEEQIHTFAYNRLPHDHKIRLPFVSRHHNL